MLQFPFYPEATRRPTGTQVGKKTVFPTLSRYTTPTPANPASLTKQEQAKSQVKTKRFHTGLSPLYAPTVPLAPHPCVRWWNTEEMPLKLTRLGLHSLRGGSPHQKTIPPRKGGFRLDGGYTPILQLRGCEGPFFDEPKNGPPHPQPFHGTNSR